MTAPVDYEGPVGFGEFDAANFPGQGSGEPTTAHKGVDIRINMNVLYRIFLRFRMAGFDHGMYVQDVKDSVGGFQWLSELGGITFYAYSLAKEALQIVGIGDGEDTSELTGTSTATVSFRSMVRDLTDPYDNATGHHANGKAFGWRIGKWLRVAMMGDGMLRHVLGDEDWTPYVVCESGTVTLKSSSKAWSKWQNNDCIAVGGELYVDSISSPPPSGWIKVYGVPFVIGNYSPVTLRLQGMNAMDPGDPQAYAAAGGSNIVLERLHFATGEARPFAAALKADSQIFFNGLMMRVPA